MRELRLRGYVGGAGALALIACTLLARPSAAGDAATAEALFQSGKQLMGQQKYAEACPKFEASFKLDKTLGTLLNLADCHEKLGKIATAWADWNDAVQRAQQEGDSRADFASKRRNALADKIPKLTVNVKNPRPGLEIFRDDIRVETAMFDTPLPVDPGAHAISVKRGDQVLKDFKVDATEGATASVQVDLAAIEKAAPPPPKASAAPTASAPDGGRPVPRGGATQKTVGLVVGGVGVVAIAGAAVLEILALAKKPGDTEHNLCVDKFCSPQGKSAADDAKTFADIGQWVGIGGIVLAAVGATLLITAPSAGSAGKSAKAPRSRVGVAPWIGPSSGGVGIGGRL